MNISKISSCTTLHNGVQMPWLGLGVHKSKDGAEVQQAVGHAIKAGYRLIDTAAIYGNEKGVGLAVRDCGVARSELFVTTKLWNDEQRIGNVQQAFNHSLQRLGLDYVDLYLVHWPLVGKYSQTWRHMEAIYASGRARAIGVSNFLAHHLTDLLQTAKVVPMVNQMEFHPYLVQQDLLDLCKQHQVQYQSWSPLMLGRVLQVDLLNQLGLKYGKNAVQIVLRWNLQKGVSTIPKSVNPQRIAANAAIFDFELMAHEMAAIDALDRHQRTGPDPDNFSF